MEHLEERIHKDIYVTVKEYLDNVGIKSSISNEIDEKLNKQASNLIFINCLETLFKYLDKKITIRKRRVYISKELETKMEKQLPNCIVKKIISIKNKFETGEDINSNLSKQIFKGDSIDYLYNIWNIKHIHLSESVEFNKSSMSRNRANYLLLCLVKDEKAYFIDAKRHPKSEGFTDSQLLEILERNNWIEEIGFVQIKDSMGLSGLCVKKEKDIYKLSKAKVNTLYEVNGKVYMNRNTTTASGVNSDIIKLCYTVNHKIREFIKNLNGEYIGFKLLLDENFGVIEYNDSFKGNKIVKKYYL